MYSRSQSVHTGQKLPPDRPLKIHEEVFIATALLHRENPERPDFSVTEILDRIKDLHLTDPLRSGVRTHIHSHCVANVRPDGGRYRTLYAAGDRRRLLLAGDDVHPERTGVIFPEADSLPPQYRELVTWAKQRYEKSGAKNARWLDSILSMAGMGKELWKGENPDEYVRRLREGWE